MKHISIIIGTRPEAIKMASVIKALRALNCFRISIVSTGQHLEMLDQALGSFSIVPDYKLEVMISDQGLAHLAGRLIIELDQLYEKINPDLVLVQGDTTTVMCAALAASYRKIRVGHIEAGLRTGNLHSPFPEEINRVIVGGLATWHFAPTENSKANLLESGVLASNILVSGNTSIDALSMVRGEVSQLNLDFSKRIILVTAHRRENLGKGLEEICSSIRYLSQKYNNILFVFPVHLNPRVRSVVLEILKNLENVILINPLEYPTFVELMRASFLIMTDSGGVQEEAAFLKKPVLVLREDTERPEGIDEGLAKLVGTSSLTITHAIETLLFDETSYKKMQEGVPPYGNGNSGYLIAKFINEHL